ncbi:hypothetical protein AVEN_74206-1 [Araneus ventricosus]|uniref:Uncharacterized protein n=1 Tax=Araneus ventricosus TaxID=182803 RepID=A0A4Y2K8R1_ARAVE|nr:hypothetical protein AVEN_74206-1 [Araneus ventricosus]
MEGKTFGRVLHFHVRDCIIDPDATVESGPVLFLGCPESFATSIQLFPIGEKNDLVRFRILSDYMCKLYKRKFDADMRIRIYFEGVFAEDEYEDRIRKGILAASAGVVGRTSKSSANEWRSSNSSDDDLH